MEEKDGKRRNIRNGLLRHVHWIFILFGFGYVYMKRNEKKFKKKFTQAHIHTHSHMMLFACLPAWRTDWLTDCHQKWLVGILPFLYISNGTEWIYNIFIDSYMFKSFHHFPHPFHISTRVPTILSFFSLPDEIRRIFQLLPLLFSGIWSNCSKVSWHLLRSLKGKRLKQFLRIREMKRALCFCVGGKV